MYSLEDVLVELLPAAQELPDHLPAQTFPLQDEPGDAHRRVRDKASLDQVLDPLLRLPADDTTRAVYLKLVCFFSLFPRLFHSFDLTSALLKSVESFQTFLGGFVIVYI